MAIPASTKIFDETLDPFDVVEFQVNLGPALESGETTTLANITLNVPTESSLLGLQVMTTGGYATTLVGNILTFWLSITAPEQTNPAFVVGATLPIEISFTTNSVPPRKKQRTVAVKVIQR